LEKLTLDLAAAVSNSCRAQLQAWLHDGTAWRRFQQMVAAQGGDVSALERITEIHAAPFQGHLLAPRGGVIRQMNAEVIGRVIVGLGGGRAQAADLIDFAVGIDQIQKVGTKIEAGQPLLRVHARSADQLAEALNQLQSAATLA
jgi:thymidine phosphorylase